MMTEFDPQNLRTVKAMRGGVLYYPGTGEIETSGSLELTSQTNSLPYLISHRPERELKNTKWMGPKQ